MKSKTRTKTSPISIAEFAREIAEHRAALGTSTKHVSALRRVLSGLFLSGVRTTADIDDDAIRRYLDGRPPDESPSTRLGALNLLHALCQFALRLGRIDRMPRLPARPQHKQLGVPPRKATLSRSEVDRVLEHLKRRADTWEGQRLYTLAALLATTGLLAGEALELRWDDCDLERSTIRVRRRLRFPFTKFPPLVPIPAPLVPILLAWREAADAEYVFPNKGRSHWWRGYRRERPSIHLASAGEEVGVSGFKPGALRRFFLENAAPFVDLEPGPVPVLSISTPGAPAPMTKREELPRRRQRAADLGTDEATRLMALLLRRSGSWEGERDFAVTGLVLYTGLKPRVILDLRMEDFDRSAGTIRIGDETDHYPLSPGAPRVLLSPDASRLLIRWIERPDQESSPWIFPGTKLLGPWNGGYMGSEPLERLKASAREAGLGHVTFESLRRLHGRCGGRVVLGEEFRAQEPPARILTGPCPRPPGPRKAGDSRGPYVPRSRRLDLVIPRPLGYIQGPDQPVIIRGRAKKLLSSAEYKPIELLAKAGPEGLSSSELTGFCGSTGWRIALRRLKERDPDWDLALEFPEKPYGRYRCRLAPKSSPGTNLHSS